VIEGIVENGRAVGVKVASAGRVQSFKAGATLLATGGLYGGGLFSDDRGRVWEPLYKLNVNASADRETWFDPSMLATHGHAAQRFGIRVTPELIPINEAGDPVAKGLYAAGHLLAQPGISAPATYSEGIALATAYHAVTQALRGD
jgi:anaerobic glycerol-3-phosphate dehydrogenase